MDKGIEELTIDIIHSPIKSRIFKEGERIAKYIKKWHCEVIAEYLYEIGYRKQSPEIKCKCEWKTWDPIGDNFCYKCGDIITNKYEHESSKLVLWEEDSLCELLNCNIKVKIVNGMCIPNSRELSKLIFSKIGIDKETLTNDLINILCEANGTGSGADDITEYILSKFGAQQSKLVPIDKTVNPKLLHALEYLAYERNPIGEKYIDTCSPTCQEKVMDALAEGKKYPLDTPAVPSVEAIEIILKDVKSSDNQEHGNWGTKEQAQAIHRLFLNGGE